MISHDHPGIGGYETSDHGDRSAQAGRTSPKVGEQVPRVERSWIGASVTTEPALVRVTRRDGRRLMGIALVSSPTWPGRFARWPPGLVVRRPARTTPRRADRRQGGHPAKVHRVGGTRHGGAAMRILGRPPTEDRLAAGLDGNDQLGFDRRLLRKGGPGFVAAPFGPCWMTWRRREDVVGSRLGSGVPEGPSGSCGTGDGFRLAGGVDAG